jgi:hypothetical protein
MSYGINPIKCYAEADFVLKNVTPYVRGEKKGETPLGERRYNKATMRKDGNGDIHCRLYDTDITTFKPNGDIVIRLNGWCSQTTLNALWAIHRVQFCIHDRRMWVACGGLANQQSKYGGKFAIPAALHPLHTNSDNVVRRADHNGFEPIEVARAVKHHIIRREANNVRRMLQPFRAYFANNLKLRGRDRPDVAEFCKAFDLSMDTYYANLRDTHVVVSNYGRPAPRTIAGFIRLASSESETQHEDFYKASLVLYNSAHAPNSSRGRLNDYMKVLDDALLYHYRDKCFKEVVPAKAWLYKDPNFRFFNTDDQRP